MIELKTRAVGNSTGVTLRKEVLDRPNIQPGDTLYLTEAPDGYRRTPHNPQVKTAESLMRRYKDALHELAK